MNLLFILQTPPAFQTKLLMIHVSSPKGRTISPQIQNPTQLTDTNSFTSLSIISKCHTKESLSAIICNFITKGQPLYIYTMTP